MTSFFSVVNKWNVRLESKTIHLDLMSEESGTKENRQGREGERGDHRGYNIRARLAESAASFPGLLVVLLE